MVWLWPLAVLALLLCPMRIGVQIAFSLFDAKVGVRATLFGIPIVRVWGDMMQGRLLLNGRPIKPTQSAVSPGAASARGTWSKRAEHRIRLVRAVWHSVQVRSQARLLVGTHDPALQWVPAAIADLVHAPHLRLIMHTADCQVCKGLAHIEVRCVLWQLLWSLVCVGVYRGRHHARPSA